jgi:hypothetical protein
MTDYTQIDWQQPRPSDHQLAADWQHIRIIDLGVEDTRLTAVRDELKRSHCNGGALLGRFAIEAPESWRWLLNRNRLQEHGFLKRFLADPTVIDAFGCSAQELAVSKAANFDMETSHVSIGRLADVIAAGGAYLTFEGSDQDVLALVRGFTSAAFDERYSDLRAFKSFEAWNGWFKGIAWDLSLIWFDARAGTITCLLITDTD